MLMEYLLNHTASIAGILLGIAYIPHIVKTYKTKDVTGVSLAFWYIIVLALSFLIINAYAVFVFTGVWGYLVTELFNLGLATVMLCLVQYYRVKQPVDSRGADNE